MKRLNLGADTSGPAPTSMRAFSLLVLATVTCAAQAPADPCVEMETAETGIAVEGGSAPDCFELPPRPPSAAVFVPFEEGSRWEFSVEAQSYHVYYGGTRYDTLGTESWQVEGTTVQGGRAVPVLHVVRADAAGAVTGRARCAVVADVETLSDGHWMRWERDIRADLAWREAEHERRARSPRGTWEPPDETRATETGAQTAAELWGPQETVRLLFETLEGDCPRIGDGAQITADPIAEVLGDLLIGADLYPSRVLGISQAAETPGSERLLWTFAGSIGPYLRVSHTETAEGQVHDVFHRLTAARVGSVSVGRALGPDLGPAPAQEPASAPDDVPRFVRVGPNPFREALTVRFAVPAAGEVSVEVFDVMGRRISRAALGEHPAGEVEFVVDGADLASGVYVVRVAVGPRAAVYRVTRVR